MKQLLPTHNRQMMWCSPRIWNPNAGFFQLDPHGPILLMVTLLTMQLIYRLANVFDGGGVPRAIAAGDQTLLQLGMLIIIPCIFSLFIVLLVVVVLPTQAVELAWFSDDRNAGRWYQFAGYVVLDVIMAVSSGLYWARELWTSE